MSLFTLSKKLLGSSIPVLCYHQVRPDSGMTPEKFGRHLDLIKKLGFQTISLRSLHQIVLKQLRPTNKSVVITFDDCTLDNWVYAMPELLRRGMRGVFFAITDFIQPGQVRPRADQTRQAEHIPAFGEIMQRAMFGNRGGFMNESEIRAVVHDLGMEVYSHSATHQACFKQAKITGILGEDKHWSHSALCGHNAHPSTPVYPVGSAYAHAGFGLDWKGNPLSLATDEERLVFCINDFSASKARLENLLEEPCPYFCLPWGDYDSITLAAAKNVGYSCVLNLKADYVGPGTDPMRIGRLAVKDRKSLKWLGLKIILLAHQSLASGVRGHFFGRRP